MSLAIPQSMPAAIGAVRALEAVQRQMPQVEIQTTHSLHAGTYARTCLIPAGVRLTGALIKIPTTVIVSGDVTVFVGDGTIRMTGYHVVEAEAGRKQVFLAHADTYLTMLFASDSDTVEEAENEFTDEADALMSRGLAKSKG